MWHEARKQEKKIRGMLVDYRRRAERRQDFYERIKADPTQFMQVHGRKSKIHLDPAVAMAGDNATIMMPWQGQTDNIIDRFDARAHLDFIPPPTNVTEDPASMSNEERQINYERYRILAQNEFLCITEEKFLQQLYLEEQYGVNAQQEAERTAAKKAQKPQGGAAIGYTYEDSTGDYPSSSSGFARTRNFSPPPTTAGGGGGGNEDDSESDLDVDVSININKLDVTQGNELNKFGRSYGMLSNDFYSFLTRDADEADAMRLAREEEHEKVLMGGRKSRRERRAQRERKFTKRFQSPPSYASKEEDFRDLVSGGGAVAVGKSKPDEENESRSPSPVNSGEITYITSFGGEDDVPAAPSALVKAKSQTMSKLQQLKSQLTLGSIIGEKREALALDRAKAAMESSNAVKPKEHVHATAGSGKRVSAAEIVAKPVLYRRRSKSKSPRRSRSRSRTRRDRYRRSSSRSRSRSISSGSSRGHRSRHRRDDRSRRRHHSRRHSMDRRRRSTSGSDSSSRSSSSSSTSSYSRRKGSGRRRDRRSMSPLPKQKPHTREIPKTAFTKRAAVVESAVVKSTVPEVQVPIKRRESTPPPPPPPPASIHLPEIQVPIKKYYGRRREDLSNSELSYSEEEEESSGRAEKPTAKAAEQRDTRQESNASRGRGTGGGGGGTTTGSGGSASSSVVKSASGPSQESSKGSSFNPRDRLKRKMQSLLNKQYKADKKAEHEKTERQMQVQQERNEEMRELAIKLRKRQRELRHKTDGNAGGGSSDENDQVDDYKSQAYAEEEEDEEERQIQARLHKLVAMSRTNDEDSHRQSHSSQQRPSDRSYDDYEAREKRYRRRDSSRERPSSSSSIHSRRRSSRDDERSPSRSRSSRWDVQRKRSPPPPSSSGNSSRSRRLVDY